MSAKREVSLIVSESTPAAVGASVLMKFRCSFSSAMRGANRSTAKHRR
jgi:hypothetical protein